jgi:hypothetical protein
VRTYVDMVKNRAGHVSERTRYLRASDHLVYLMPLRAVCLGNRVSLTFICLKGATLRDRLESDTSDRRDVPILY